MRSREWSRLSVMPCHRITTSSDRASEAPSRRDAVARETIDFNEHGGESSLGAFAASVRTTWALTSGRVKPYECRCPMHRGRVD